MNILIAGSFVSVSGYIVLRLIEQGKNLITSDDLSSSLSKALEIISFFWNDYPANNPNDYDL